MKATPAPLVALGMAVMLVASTAAAQTQGGLTSSLVGGLDAPPAPPAPPPSPASMCLVLETGHAFLSGQATAENSRPLFNLDIEMLNLESRRACRTATEKDGTYEIPNLPAGTYRFTIRRAPEYFAVDGDQVVSPERATVPVTLADGQRLEHFDFHFIRGSTIKGHVVDAHDLPVPNIQVRAANFDASIAWPGRIIPTSITDDRGNFIIRPLLSGRYYVIAEEPTAGPWAPIAAAHHQFALTYFPGTTYPAAALTLNVTPDNPGDARIVMVPIGALR